MPARDWVDPLSFSWRRSTVVLPTIHIQRQPRDRGSAGAIFELIADPTQQPRWDGNDNLAAAAVGQRIRGIGAVFTMTLTKGSVWENHVVEFHEGRRIA